MKSDINTDICLDPPLDDIWNQVLELLVKRVSKPSYMSWVRPLLLTKLTVDQAIISVANDFAKSQVISRTLPDIEVALEQLLGRKISISIIVDPSVKRDYSPSIASISVVQEENAHNLDTQKNNINNNHIKSGNTSLNSKHLFDSFVVGSSNRFCHSAALAVAEKPGQSYNPLFLYGGVGLGKTHLLHAIGNSVLQKSPNMVIRYMSCEKFTNELINSIRHDQMTDFRKKYRQIDLLLMDDIQFIEGKESTQEEFFHTFNTLRDNGKQIVLTSDRPPKALSLLAERLRSRFEWGLIADIQSPDYEMRLAILRKKADLEKIAISEPILEYVANTFRSNIRELEGALLRIQAYSRLTGEPLTINTVSEILLPSNQRKPKEPITIEKLLNTVSAYYHVESADLKSSKRSQDLTVPRHVAMYLAHKILSLSFPRIGQAFGNRKHTSALYAYDKIKESISENQDLAEAIRELSHQLEN